MWKVTKIEQTSFEATRVPFEHEIETEQKTVTVEYKDFHKHFWPGFCITTHSAQGLSLTNYTIYDWERMDTRLRYVALSRAKGMDSGVQIDAPQRPRWLSPQFQF